jgi:hypothetical protein
MHKLLCVVFAMIIILTGCGQQTVEQEPVWTGEYNGLKVAVNSYEVGKNEHTGKPKLFINVAAENTAEYSFNVRFRGEHARVVEPNYDGDDLVESGEVKEYDLEAYVLEDDVKEIVLRFVLYDMNKDKLKYLDVKLPLNN